MWKKKDLTALLDELETTKQGLDRDEAEKRLRRYGKNRLEQKKQKNAVMRFFSAMSDPMTLVLLCAAVISYFTSRLSGEGAADSLMILTIVAANAIISVIQEQKADKALEALKKMSAPTCRVIRDGVPTTVPGEEVVPGDVIILDKGDVVPCDCRVLESYGLACNESCLTGESKEVHKTQFRTKNTDESANCLFGSSGVVLGRGVAVAVKTGMETEVGRIASLLSGKEEKTPLQKRLSSLSVMLGKVTVGICAVIFLFSLLKGMELREMFITGVSLSVAAIPEGLPAIVTVVLSVGVQTMAGKNAIVKKLPAVETLGSADVICSDKTGTLTCNRMTVTETMGDSSRLETAFALCNDCSSPTENALAEYLPKTRFDELQQQFPRVLEIPFDPKRKFMITVHKSGSGFLSVIKGAPDVISSFCAGKKTGFENEGEEMASRGLRVMGFGLCETDSLPKNAEKLTYRPVGICGITDPPRPEAAGAVKICRNAGIRTVMITGDHPHTARAIARSVGIAEEGGMVLTEKEVAAADPRQMQKLVKKCSVFARVTPESKLKIVKAFQKNGCTVAMTGDGVNDAPALKRADIGCAMGKSGTEVAKEAADMILTDDNFATVVSAVREGRGVYQNIRRAVHFLLSCNVGELFTVFLSILLSFPSPLSAIQLLWVNLTTDSLPAIALGLEKTHESVMKNRPNPKRSPLFSAGETVRMLMEGLLIGGLAVTAFAVGKAGGGFQKGRTMCFFVLAVSQLFHSFNMRCECSVFSKRKKKNPYLPIAFAVCLSMMLFVVLVPAARELFGVSALEKTDFCICFFLSAVPLAACEIYKFFTQKTSFRHKA